MEKLPLTKLNIPCDINPKEAKYLRVTHQHPEGKVHLPTTLT